MPKPLVSRTIALAKRHPIKTFVSIITILGGLPAAWAGALMLEPAVPAWKGYVREQVQVAQGLVLPAVRDTQLDVARAGIRASKREKRELERDLLATTDPAYRSRLKDDIEEADATIKKLIDQINTIDVEKAKGR